MLERITASLSSLAPAEQRVAKLVLTDPRAFARLPVRELAERAHVSKPTVVRFCRSMGYDGLADFKLKLAGSVSEGVPFIHRSVDVDDKTGDVLVKVVDNAVAAFLQYRNAASTVALERAAQAISDTWKKGKRIEFYGVGNSGMGTYHGEEGFRELSHARTVFLRHRFFPIGLFYPPFGNAVQRLVLRLWLGAGDPALQTSRKDTP